MTNDNRKTRLATPVRDDQIGKPFLVLGQGIRKCLVCEQLFTRREAPGHATVACYPRRQGGQSYATFECGPWQLDMGEQ